MKTLTILRHAKSSWDHPDLDDFDRPLNDRGREAARAIGRELKRRSIAFDHVLASPAVRVRETLEELTRAYGSQFDTRFEPDLYMASAQGVLQQVRRIPDQCGSPLIVGHNPAVQRLILDLTGDDDRGLRRRVTAKYPTAALAVIELPEQGWARTELGTGRLVELILPRELGD